jgi:hypothetical protein
MPIRKRLQVSPYDSQIFRYLFEHRMLRIDHLQLLTGRSYEALKHRLADLADAGYVTCKRRPFQKHIIALGRGAVGHLVEQGIAPKEALIDRIRHGELKDLFLDHFMMIVDFHVALAVAGQAGHFRIAAWRQGEELKDHVTLRNRGGLETLCVWPDAFFILEDDHAPARWRPIAFAYEAARQRQSKRDRDKILAYLNYFQQGRHRSKYGVETFRVLTEALTKKRAQNLCDLAGELLPRPARKFYLFTSLEDFSPFSPRTLLGQTVITPHDRKRQTIIPALSTGSDIGPQSKLMLGVRPKE